MTVKRYDSRIGNSMGLSVPCSEMYANPVGQFVTYSDYQKLVAENVELKSRTVKVPAKVYVKDMKSNVVRWAQVIDALSDAGIAFSRDDGELIAGTRETPATDAAIAEIGAKAVEQAAEFAPWLYGSQLGVQVEAVPREELIEFAANLRAGRKG